MGWRLRKSFRRGPLNISLSKRGAGFSLGIPGFRIGVSANGSTYLSFGIPNTGLYWIKYFGKNKVT